MFFWNPLLYFYCSAFKWLSFMLLTLTWVGQLYCPAQVQVFNLVSHIKTAAGLEKLRQQLAAFYAKQIDEEMDALWESGQFDEKRLQELRGSHFRTPYNK